MDRGPEAMDRTEREQESALERDLTAALRHTDAPAGFADRVMARATPPKRATMLAFPRWRTAVSGAMAASVIAATFLAGTFQHRREQARERATANQQFETATRITDQTLAHTREQLERAGIFRED